MKSALSICVLLLFLWVSETKSSEEYYEKYYEGLGALSFYNSLGYYNHINDRDEESGIARAIILESFTYFVNQEKKLISQSQRVEKAILYACSNLKEIDRKFSDPYRREENTGFTFNPAAIKNDADYHDLVDKFKRFIEKGQVRDGNTSKKKHQKGQK